jgi:beta-galactosidase GanA
MTLYTQESAGRRGSVPTSGDLPRLERRGESVRLIVDGSPYLAIGGELHNSTSSDETYLDRACEKLAGCGMATIVAAVSWAEVEPHEGDFDFAPVARLLAVARKYGQRVVLIWFGAYKNARSTYAPTWVRADVGRFPRALMHASEFASPFSYEGSMPKPELSVFSKDLRDADTAAYLAMVAYVRDMDTARTVIMLQVENEVGLLGSGRDRSVPADDAWNAAVPEEVLDVLSTHPEYQDSWLAERARTHTGTWAEVFGEDNRSDELFMSWGFATYVEHVAASGKEILPLPTLVNAWLGPQPGQSLAGQYPSGGPTSAMIPIWEALAPSIDVIAPDIYVEDSESAMREYSRDGRALFIPEARFRVADLFHAIGRYNAIGYCAFGAEDGRPGNQYFTASQLLLNHTSEIIEAQTAGTIRSIAVDGHTPDIMRIGNYTITVHSTRDLFSRVLVDAGVAAPSAPEPLEPESLSGPFGPDLAETRAFGAILQTADDEFLLLGSGFTIDFAHDTDIVELDHVREIRNEAGKWLEGRILNGDEHMRLVPTDSIGASRIRLLRRPAH